MNFLHDISSRVYINLNFNLPNKKYIYLARLVVISFLIALPYISNITLITFILFIQITLVIIMRSCYLIKLLALYIKIFFFSLNTIIANYFMKNNYFMHISVSHISFVYYLKIIPLLIIKRFILKFHIYYIIFQIPRYIKTIIILNTLYMIICYHITIFIKGEIINKTLYTGYKYLSTLKFSVCNKMIINILISSQILERIIERVNSLYLGIKIKNKNHNKEVIRYVIFYNRKLFNKILKDQNDLNITLWIRSIKNKFNNKIYID
uniref:Uncharacterized protein n=1 Tax=Dictyomenia sonderi TaxID=2007178 RepID=A0A1Z1MTF8_9FLOR|nr:hypothetical protein [Dictyomenia sonderi]ARW69102.1 hypothetical protein [Dictyomenia sonderi]